LLNLRFWLPEKISDNYVRKQLANVDQQDLASCITLYNDENRLVITLSRFGTSKFIFNETVTDDGGVEYELVEEQVAMVHRPVKTMFTEKIESVVRYLGGRVLQPNTVH
jgi:hypothetical protein